MDNEIQKLADEVAYSCIFHATPESAAEHILKLISQKAVFEKEPDYYRTRFSEMLDTYPMESLSRFGAGFSGDQWRVILETVLTRLGRGEKLES